MKPNTLLKLKLKLNKRYFFSYILICFLSILFLYFFDIKFGIAAVVIAYANLIYSYFFTLSAIKKMKFKYIISSASLSKGNDLTFRIEIKNTSLTMIPFLHIKFLNSANLITNSPREIVLSIGNTIPQVINQQYTAIIWGVTDIGIESIVATGFFGIFSFQLKAQNNARVFTQKINILPDIPDIYMNDLLKESIENCLSDEEETNEQIPSLNGTPGFEYRKYIPGDSLKLINWKLSSKCGEYMVRLYEPIGKAKQVILIDSLSLEGYLEDDAMALALKEQKTIEAVLGMLMLMAKQQLQCFVHYFIDEKWQTFIVNNEADVELFQFTLSKYKFINKKDLYKEIPPNTIESAGSIMYFANLLVDENLNQISQIKNSGSQVNIVTPDSSYNLYENCWFVNDNFEFIRL